MLRLLNSFALLMLCLTVCFAQQQQQGPMPFQSPAVSRAQIAFVYAGSVWIADRDGGDARRLTTAPGDETAPAFSPDGAQIAFSKNVGGNMDVYVMPAVGGEMRRLTFHPKPDIVVNWTPDGKSVLFSSTRTSDSFSRIYQIPAAGGFETDLPFPMGFSASLSPDGTRAALAPRRTPASWRNYRGGLASSIQIVRLSDSQIEATLPHDNSNDVSPMWIGGSVYFISDRTGTANLFVYDNETKKVSQLTKFEKTDIKAAAAGGDAIIFAQGGRLQLYDLKSNQARLIPIRVAGEFPETQARTVKAARWINSFSLSPTGKEIVFGARGEILALNVEKNESRNLTQTPGVAERSPSWSPDGKLIAYFSDESGEYQLHVRPANGEGAARKIIIERNPSFYSEPVWSPDSKKVAFSDKRLSLFYVDLERGAAQKIDTSNFAREGNFAVSWSPDSRWLAYAKFVPSRQRGIFLYSLDTGKITTVSANRIDADSPLFDRGGKYLYFLSSTNAGPGRVFGMSAFTSAPIVTSTVNLVVLRSDMPSPALPPGNQETPKTEAGAFRIDLENINGRILQMPAPSLDYTTLSVGREGVLFASANDWSNFSGGENPPQVIYKLDLNNRKSDKFLEGVSAATVSDDGSRLAYQKRGDNWLVVNTDAQPKPDEGKLDLDKLEIRVEPRAEWQQMYDEAWRIVRDYFYDVKVHGQNLAALKKSYAAYLPGVATRSDLNYLFRDMLSNLSISHMAIGGGDTPASGGDANVGMLGADYTIENNRYRITRIYRGDNSHPLLMSPLTQPGVNVKEGEYLLAVDGKEIIASENLYSYFQGMGRGRRPTQIKVGTKADGSDARTVTVMPIVGENTLRTFVWTENNRRRVEEMSGGKLAYIYLPNTGVPGYTAFNRDFYGQLDKQGVIVDERFNSGGAPADYFIEVLRRTPLSYYAFREGDDLPFPANALPGPRVMIINEFAGSGGDTLPWMFRQAGLGTLVGQRTYGAGIGGYLNIPDLIDGGEVSAPNRAFYNPKKGILDIENNGVAPDIAVEFTPADWRAGRDPQLEKAVQVALEALKKNPPVAPKRPTFPSFN